MKRIRISQGKFIGNDYIQPTFPVNDESVKEMLASGIATDTKSDHATWGSGIYERIDGKWECIDYNWDTSG